LIAKDDLIIADMVEDLLVVSGYEVCGIGRTVADRLRSLSATSLILLSSTCDSPMRVWHRHPRGEPRY
jgi:hypothetical protein